MQRFLPLALAGLLLLLASPDPVAAQSSEVPRATRTFAIENAQVVQAPGQVLSNATVVIRDGQILSVGSNVQVPFDAQRIEGDSLTVYAGFIDGLSHAGIPQPRDGNDRPDVDNPGEPPRDVAGIQPDRDARTMLEAGHKSIADLREAGFTTAHVVPHGRMLPGQGAIIALGGDRPESMVLRGNAAMIAQFEGGQGVYPATPMAIMAEFRQLYTEAQRRQQMEVRFASAEANATRPAYDPVHYAFFPVLDGDQPVMFYVEDPRETRRALRLQNELGFPLVLAGLYATTDVTEELAAQQVPAFLSLQMPKPIKAIDEDSSTYDPDFRVTTHADTEAEAANLRARQAEARQRVVEHASMLAAAGVPFGFMTRDVKANDIKDNLSTMVAHGLSEEDALAALTTVPAALLGLDARLGTVEPGKIANLVLTRGSYFDEDGEIAHVFVDGQLYDIDAPAAPVAEGELVNPVGTWAYDVSTPQGAYTGTLTLTGSRDLLEGTVTVTGGSAPIPVESADLRGNELTFTFDSGSFGVVEMTVSLTTEDFNGTVLVGTDAFPVSGSRTSGPDQR